MSLNQRINSGANVETAQEILDNLNANPTAGATNAAIDMGGRTEEPAKGPKAFTGIDSLYDRGYEYDSMGVWTAAVLRQFFELGTGERVSARALRALWKEGEPAMALQPARLQPGGGDAPAVQPKLKRSEESAAARRIEKLMRNNVRDQKRLRGAIDAAEAEAAVEAAATTHRCPQCRHRPFLSKGGLARHAADYCPYRPAAQATQSVHACRVHAGMRTAGGPVRLELRVAAGGGVSARPLLCGPVQLRLKVHRPLTPLQAYGLPTFAAAAPTATASVAKLSAVCGVSSAGLQVALRIVADKRRGALPRVMLQIGSVRPRPELLAKGWAQRPPVLHTRFTQEQRAMLVELFERKDRPNESQMFEMFRSRFCHADGPHARALRLTRSKIKSFMSTEKSRRQKAAVAGAVAAALEDGTLAAEEGDSSDDEDAAEAEAQHEKGGRKERAAGGCPPVTEMRKAAAALGWGKDAQAAKGKKAVLTVLQKAQGAPRAQPVAAGGGKSSGEEDEGEGEEVEKGSDTYQVDELRGKRRRGGMIEYFVKWQGFSSRWDTWEPMGNLPQLVVRQFEDERGPEEETDEEETESDSEDEPLTTDAPADSSTAEAAAALTTAPAVAVPATKKRRAVPIDSSDDEVDPAFTGAPVAAVPAAKRRAVPRPGAVAAVPRKQGRLAAVLPAAAPRKRGQSVV